MRTAWCLPNTLSAPSHAAFTKSKCVINNNNNNLQAFQLIVLARYLLGVPNPSPVSQHALT